MARELNQNLAAFLQSGAGSNFASWCEIILPELPGSPVANQLGRVYRFATTGCKGGNLVIDSAQYEPYLKTLGEIKRTTTTQTETATITLINTNNELGNVLLKDTDVLHGATVRCGRWWEDPKTATQYSYQQFKGVVDGIEANQDAITLTLISDLYAARTIGGGRKIDRACQFVFNSPAVRLAGTGKGAQCAYTGTLTTCNKLYDDADGCSGRSNQAHYGGFVKLEGKNPTSNATQAVANYSLAKTIVLNDTTDVVTTIAMRKTLASIAEEGVTLRDNAVLDVTEIGSVGTPTRWRNLITDFMASPDAHLYEGSISSGTAALTMDSVETWKVGHGILVEGAGAAGADLISTVIAIAGLVITLDDNASTTVSANRVQHDNSAAIQAAVDEFEQRGIYIPRGEYMYAAQITLPTNITEGVPCHIRGAGKGVTKLYYQNTNDGFVGQASSSITNFRFEKLTLSCTQPGAPSSTNAANSKGWAFNLLENTVVNRATFKDVIVNGWGRGALIGSNLQNCHFPGMEVRQFNTCAIALVSPETVFAGAAECNVTNITDCLIELGNYVNDTDTALTGLSWASGSKTITAGSSLFTSGMVGRFIEIDNAGQSGGNVLTIVKSYVSATQITVAAANNSGGSIAGTGTGTVYKTNVSGIFLHRASHGKHVNNTIQGNWSGAHDGHVTSAVKVRGSSGVQIDNLWVEDSGGNGGPDIDLVDTDSVTITGYHSNADPGLAPGCHGNFIDLHNAKNTYVSGMSAINSVSPFEITGDSSLFVDNSYLGYPVGRFTGHDKVIYGENVKFRLNGDENVGNAGIYDAFYGEQYVANPRFAGSSLTGWTQDIPAALSTVSAGTGREDEYVVVNRQGASTSASYSLALSQTIAIPDNVPAGPWVLGVDWRIADFGTPRGASGGGGAYIEIGATGTGSTGYPVSPASGLRWSNNTSDGTPEDEWFRSNFRLQLGTGTSRTFIIRVYMTAGAQTPILHFTNWRLHSGRHAAYSHEQPVTSDDFSASATFKIPVSAGAAPTASGAMAFDSTTKSLEYGQNGTNRIVPICFYTLPITKTFNNTATETTLFDTNPIIPANWWDVGRTLEIKLRGLIYTAASAPTLRIKVKLGSTILADSTALTMTSLSAGSARVFECAATITCLSTGNPGSIDCVGSFSYQTGNLTRDFIEVPNQYTGVNTGANQTLSVTAQFGTASGNNSFEVNTGWVMGYAN